MCECDMQKNIRIELAALLLNHRKTLQIVIVTIMVNDCSTISISDMSAVFKYYMVKNKSDTLCLNWKKITACVYL